MAVQFGIIWLLCTVAFILGGPYGPAPAPYGARGIIMCAVSGVLVAIAIVIVPQLGHGVL
jgi:hypothetical protein